MPLQQIISLLRETLGLDVASVGIGLIERAVKRRLEANGLRDISQYIGLLGCSEPEVQSLFEAVVIPETFFFRYPESFTALREIVRERFVMGTQKLRALSVPCSTGEEPYSIAMTLLDAGLPSERWQIDAMDISTHLLDIARLGLFGSNSFRGNDLQYRDQYFEKTDTVFRLSGRVRQCVKFEQANVLEERFGFSDEPYHFIYCRNLLIYFYDEAQDRVLQSLRRLLTPEGILFVGPAETSLLTQHRFSPMKLPMAFAFRKSESMAFHGPPPLKQSKIRTAASAGRSKPNRHLELAVRRKALPETAEREMGQVTDLALAEKLADRGQLAEAAEICEVSLREHGPSARAFHLLGLISDCAGDQGQATEFYRKALYLEPEHYDALIHLALIKDKTGDIAAAKALKNRARLLLEQTK